MGLDLENFDFKSYLVSIGYPEKYSSMPAVIEILKTRLKTVKEDDEFELTERGIIYKEDAIRVDKSGNLRLDARTFFVEKNGLLRYIEDEFSKLKVTTINEYGAVEGIIYSKKPPFIDDYEKTERKLKGDTPYIEFVVSYGSNNRQESYLSDVGDPVNLGKNSRSFAENYRYYTRKYPELKKWYKDRYGVNGSTVDKFSKSLKEKQDDLEIDLLNKQVKTFNGYIKEAKKKLEEYEEKLNQKVSEIKRKKKWSLLRRPMFSYILKEMDKEFQKIDSKDDLMFNSTDEKVKINHEKEEKDHTEPLTEKEQKIEKLQNKITDKKIELQKIEDNIGKDISKIEAVDSIVRDFQS